MSEDERICACVRYATSDRSTESTLETDSLTAQTD